MATKTTYATFLLYSLFHSGVLGAEARQHEGADLQREGRGPALPRPRERRSSRRPTATRYRALGLAPGAVRLASRSTRRPARATRTPAPTSRPARTACTPSTGRSRSSSTDELLPFVFADAEDERQQYTMVIHNVAAAPADATAARRRRRRVGDRRRNDRAPTASSSTSSSSGCTDDGDRARLGRARRRAWARSTRSSAGCCRRSARSAALVRADVAAAPRPPHRHVRRAGHRRRPPQPPRPGEALRRRRHDAHARSTTRKQPGTPRPLLFLVLDELNKYAPPRGRLADQGDPARRRRAGPRRSASSSSARSRPRARSSGASSPTRRSASPAGSTPPRRRAPEYGFLPAAHRQRATIAKPGTMFVSQPEIPVPLVVEFPFPAWATRPVGTRRRTAAEPARRGRRRPVRRARPVEADARVVKLLHTVRLARRQACCKGSRASTSTAPCSPRSSRIAAREQVDVVLVVGRRVRDRRPRRPRRRRVVFEDAARRCANRRRRRRRSRGNHDNAARFEAVRPVFAAARHHACSAVLHAPTTAASSSSRDARRRAGARSRCCRSCSQRCIVRADRADGARRGRATPALRRADAAAARRLTAGFAADAVNVVVAHGMVTGGTLGGGERDAQTHLSTTAVGAPRSPRRRTTSRSATCTARSRSPAPARSGTAGSPIAGRLRRGGRRQAGARGRSARRRRRPRCGAVALAVGRRLRTADGQRSTSWQRCAGDDRRRDTAGWSSHEAGARRPGRRGARAAADRGRRAGRTGGAGDGRPGRRPHAGAQRRDELFPEYLAERGRRRRSARRAVRRAARRGDDGLMRPVRLEIAGVRPRSATRRASTSKGADFFALVGPTGSGKSTVIDAICFALYGSVPRYDDERLVAPVDHDGCATRRRCRSRSTSKASGTSPPGSCAARRAVRALPRSAARARARRRDAGGCRERCRRGRRSAARASVRHTSRSASCCHRGSSRGSSTTSRPNGRTCSWSCSTSASTAHRVQQARALAAQHDNEVASDRRRLDELAQFATDERKQETTARLDACATVRTELRATKPKIEQLTKAAEPRRSRCEIGRPGHVAARDRAAARGHQARDRAGAAPTTRSRAAEGAVKEAEAETARMVDAIAEAPELRAVDAGPRGAHRTDGRRQGAHRRDAVRSMPWGRPRTPSARRGRARNGGE